MPIKINVPYHDKNRAKALGAWWLAAEKTWAVPDSVTDINPFAEWLPKDEGYIVQSPHIVVESGRDCWKCHKETPLIALGATSFYTLDYETGDELRWTHLAYAVLFNDVQGIDEELASELQRRYPFYRLAYSKTFGGRYWANNCVHCGSLQGDNYNFMGEAGIFWFWKPEDVNVRIRRMYLKMRFNYYIRSSRFESESNDWVLGVEE